MLCSLGLGRFQISWGPFVLGRLSCLFGERRARPFYSMKLSMTNHVNSRIVDGKIICFICGCWLFSLLLGDFLTWGFSLWKFSVCSIVHWNSQKSSYCCLVITFSTCEYCLIWALNKSILFGINSLKVSVLCDMNSEKGFYYSLISKELYENVSIV